MNGCVDEKMQRDIEYAKGFLHGVRVCTTLLRSLSASEYLKGNYRASDSLSRVDSYVFSLYGLNGIALHELAARLAEERKALDGKHEIRDSARYVCGDKGCSAVEDVARRVSDESGMGAGAD